MLTTLLTYKGTAVDAETGSKTELETSAADPNTLAAILAALGTVRGVLRELGIPPGDEILDTYTDAVLATRTA